MASLRTNLTVRITSKTVLEVIESRDYLSFLHKFNEPPS